MSAAATPNIETLPINARCGNMRVPDTDFTAERAIECNAPAAVECESCGVLCPSCYQDELCIFSEHKIIAVRF